MTDERVHPEDSECPQCSAELERHALTTGGGRQIGICPECPWDGWLDASPDRPTSEGEGEDCLDMAEEWLHTDFPGARETFQTVKALRDEVIRLRRAGEGEQEEEGVEDYEWPPLDDLPRATNQEEDWVPGPYEEVVTALIREDDGEWYYLARWRHPDVVDFYGDGKTRSDAVRSLIGATDAMLQAYNDDEFMGRRAGEGDSGRWEHHVVWQKGERFYIANLADGENGIGPFDREEDAERCLTALQDEAVGEPDRWLVQHTSPGGGWMDGECHDNRDEALEEARSGRLEKGWTKIVPLYTTHREETDDEDD